MVDSSSRYRPALSTSGSDSGRLISAASASSSGRTIGHYRTLRELGRGSFGVVYLAQHMSQGHQVALKLLLNSAGEEELRRFFREGELAQRLNHPGIVRVLDRGVHQNLPWLAMEYCPGSNLRERLQLGALSVDEALQLVLQVADALEAAHAAGVIHRDLKPANILIDPSGRPRVTDFGLARGGGDSGLTRTGDGLGSPLYMPPEQFQNAKHVDARADVYALGLVLYEALTAQRPFEGSTVVELTQAIHQGVSVPLRARRPEVPGWLAKVCETAFARDLNDRYPSVAAFREALQAGDTALRLKQPVPQARRAAGSERLRASLQPLGQRRVPLKLALAGLAVGLALAAGVAAFAFAQVRANHRAERLAEARAEVAGGDLQDARLAQARARAVGAEDPALDSALALLERCVEAEAALQEGQAGPARELVAEVPPGDEALTPWRYGRLERLHLQVRAVDTLANPRPGSDLDDLIRDLTGARDVEAIRDRLAQALLDRAMATSRQKAPLEDVLAILDPARRAAVAPDLRAAIALEEASVHFRRGRFARATELANRLRDEPGRLGYQARYVAAFGKLWLDATAQEGLDELEALWKLDTSGPVGLNAKAVWHSYNGMNDKGEGFALRSIELDPDYVDPYISLAFCRNDLYHRIKDAGYLQRSLEASSHAIQLQPDHPRAYMAHAFASGNLRRTEECLRDYDAVIALTEPEPFARALRNRAQQHLAAKDKLKALKDYTRSLEVSPGHVEALLLRGYVYYTLDRRQDAAQDWIAGLESNRESFLRQVQRTGLGRAVEEILREARRPR